MAMETNIIPHPAMLPIKSVTVSAIFVINKSSILLPWALLPSIAIFPPPFFMIHRD